MNGKTQIEYYAERTIADGQTGELLERQTEIHTKTIHRNEPPFIKLYLEDILYMSDMPKAYSSVVYRLLNYTTYANTKNGLCVILNPYVKKEILKECGWDNMRSLNNALTKLVKGGILKRLGEGTYQFNPYLFGKGEWKDIDNIRVEWDYNAIKGKSFNTVISYKKEDNNEQTEPTETSTDTLRSVI